MMVEAAPPLSRAPQAGYTVLDNSTRALGPVRTMSVAVDYDSTLCSPPPRPPPPLPPPSPFPPPNPPAPPLPAAPTFPSSMCSGFFMPAAYSGSGAPSSLPSGAPGFVIQINTTQSVILTSLTLPILSDGVFVAAFYRVGTLQDVGFLQSSQGWALATAQRCGLRSDIRGSPSPRSFTPVQPLPRRSRLPRAPGSALTAPAVLCPPQGVLFPVQEPQGEPEFCAESNLPRSETVVPPVPGGDVRSG